MKDKRLITVVCIADLQGMCYEVEPEQLPKGDILLIAGDLAGWGTMQEINDVNDWLGSLDYKHKIVIAGNHDQYLARADGHKVFTNATYIQDELVEVMGLKIYGTPLNEMNQYRLYNDWAFCHPTYLAEAAAKIPADLDILLTHGPAYGFVDRVAHGLNVGSKELRDAVLKKKPRYVVCGHIHEAHGIEEHFDTTFVNAALCSNRNVMLKDDGSLFYEPIVLNIEARS